ncbi:carbohydrate porin [Adhaeribacter terreus]|uniref:Carbohydrate porin n=1 Tax=Adhaeribacter terreus TaxID=529703 RepID=A0ABW0EDN6_9BACT
MKKFTLYLILFLLPWSGYSQQSTDSIAAPPPETHHQRLSGDLGGLAPKMVAHGVILLLSSTHFYQGLLSGSGEHEFKYGGKGDAFLILDWEKLGLWKGFGMISHGEIRYGKSVFDEGGNLIPANTALLFPEEEGTAVALSSLFFTQKLGEKIKLMVGRINTLDFLAMNHYYGGRGIDGFQNIIFTAPPLDARTTPVTTLGLMTVYDLEPLELTLGAWDSRERINEYGFSGLFDNGVSVTGELALKTAWGGRKGKYAVGGTWSSLEETSLSNSAKLFLPNSELPLAVEKGSWVVNFTFEQNLLGPAENPRSGWGIFGRAGISDGNPNPLRWTAMGGIAGCPFSKRANDRFGLGYFKAGLSSDVKDRALLSLFVQNEQGAEAYYSFAPIPWFILTANVQWIEPFRKRSDNAWYGGLRLKIKI